MNHVITVNDRQIDIDERFVIANGMNVDTFEVVVDGEWKDFDIVVAFEDKKGNSIKMDYDGGVVAIPSKAIENEGTLSVSVIGYKGEGKYRLTTAKASTSGLPSSGNKVGDVWFVQADSSEYAWDGTKWEELGAIVDLSNYVQYTDLVPISTSYIESMFD